MGAMRRFRPHRRGFEDEGLSPGASWSSSDPRADRTKPRRDPLSRSRAPSCAPWQLGGAPSRPGRRTISLFFSTASRRLINPGCAPTRAVQRPAGSLHFPCERMASSTQPPSPLRSGSCPAAPAARPRARAGAKRMISALLLRRQSVPAAAAKRWWRERLVVRGMVALRACTPVMSTAGIV